MNELPILLNDFRQAVFRLSDALAQTENEFIRDACIQRFEFCFELAWKSVRAVAGSYGQECQSPRMAFALALRNGWIADEAGWLDMLEARNKTSHTYRESMAKEVFAELPRFAKYLDLLQQTLNDKLHRIKEGELKYE